MKLPRDKREFALFLIIISLISVNVIAPAISFCEAGLSADTYFGALAIMPAVWAAVVAVVLLTHRPAEWLARKTVRERDGFRAAIAKNTACTVLLISIAMTVIGAWIAMGSVDPGAIEAFPYRWPRNFAIALCVELFLAQPVARMAVERLHLRRDARAGAA
ncbi:MAG: hypothetical protein LBG62_00670 [Candidatus Methanoplasma sp.]|jgi:cytochrome bd-type quinol oxidase subunit 2|nr:hypothetical protein [Candidatus Methanoplasma sp.]